MKRLRIAFLILALVATLAAVLSFAQPKDLGAIGSPFNYTPPPAKDTVVPMGDGTFYVYDGLRGNVYFRNADDTVRADSPEALKAKLAANRSLAVIIVMVPVNAPGVVTPAIPQCALLDSTGNVAQVFVGSNFFQDQPARFWKIDEMDSVGAVTNRPLTGSAFRALVEKFKPNAKPGRFDPQTNACTLAQ